MNETLNHALGASVGADNILTGDAVRQRNTYWGQHTPCQADAIVRPGDTAELVQVVRACARARCAMVPMGGLTGLVNGCVAQPGQIGLSLERMRHLEAVSTTDFTLTAQAGMFFPVDIGARGTCTVGGIISTNAGGTKVIRYGMTRESILGLEAVMANGTVVSSMNGFVKNNTGFDLKHLFVGTEGTLGIVTRAVVRLSSQPRSHNVALLGLNDYDSVVATLGVARQLLGATLTGFEVMWDSFMQTATRQNQDDDGGDPVRNPLGRSWPVYVLIESMGADQAVDQRQFETTLNGLLEQALVGDAVLASSGQQRQSIWAVRESVEYLLSNAINYDVSLRVADMQRYLDDLNTALAARRGLDVVGFGHLGDNNLHLALVVGRENTHEEALEAELDQAVYGVLKKYGGAISAEHGIGLKRKPWLHLSRSQEEIALMQTLKQAMDPHNLLNPGKVI